jgi:hypothetical protein
MYARVMNYTPVRSLGFLNVCMLGKQLSLLDVIPPKLEALQNIGLLKPITLTMTS